MPQASRSSRVLALVPGALTVALAFSAGGWFPGTVALGACAVAALLVLQLLGADDPLGGLSPALAVAGGALALLACWTLLSGSWSHAPARAVLEGDRVLLYLLALALLGALPRTPERVRWLVRGMALGAGVVCAAALVTRLLPHVWPTAPGFLPQRLSYPITYWNALGLLAAIGLVLCLHLAAADREPRAVRVLGAAALPVLASTLLLTYSRGAIACGAVGLVAYVALARSRGLAGALLAASGPAAVAVAVAYGAGDLAGQHPTSAAAVVQGRHVAIAVGLAVLAAGALRALTLRLDDRLAAVRLRSLRSPLARLAATAAAVAVAAVVVAGTPVHGAVAEELHQFVAHRQVQTADARARLTDPGNDGRLAHWSAALAGFRSDPLRGQGAGTYEFQWQRRRTVGYPVVDAHSLYLETLDELGVVGFALLVTALVAILVGLARRIRGRERAVHAALFAAAVVWVLHAGIDWDWEMPVVTLWLFAAGGLVLARPATLVGRVRARPPTRITRVGLAAAVVGLAALPAVVAASQQHLDSSVSAAQRGDCATADRQALASVAALGDRPEPFEVLGYCDARAGRWPAAVRALDAAVRREPANWRWHYELALMRAGAGLDPRPAALAAARLDPLDPTARAAVLTFARIHRRSWRRIALRAVHAGGWARSSSTAGAGGASDG